MISTAAQVTIVMLDHHMGNCVVALPTVAAFARYFVKGVDLLIDRRWASIAAQMQCEEGAVRVIPIEVRNGLGGRGMAGQMRAVSQVLQLRRRYDVAIDLTGTKRGNLTAWLTGARVRIGQGWSERPWCFTRRLNTLRHTHCLRLYGQMLAFIGVDALPPRVRLVATPERRARIDRLLGPMGGKPFMVVHASAGKAFREWPADRFAAAANGMFQSSGLGCVVIGTANDRATAEAIFAKLDSQVPRLFIASAPADLVALFERADLFLSNESGPTHVAAATDVPIVTIFGPTSEHLWGPIRTKQIAVLRGAPCVAACGKRRCLSNNHCLTSLSVKEVVDAAKALLDPISSRQSARDNRDVTGDAPILCHWSSP